MKAKQEPRFRLKPLNLALRRIGIGTLIVSAATSSFMDRAHAELPGGGTVTAGAATISNSDANHQTITQTSDKAVVNWNTFSIGNSDSVRFVQPAASSVILNRVIGGSSSSILGSLSANGQVFLVNPQGIYFGAGASIDVGGLVATTLNIADRDFLSGNYVFSRDPSAPLRAEIVNQGKITVGPGGYVVLIGDYVGNSGAIQAQLGTVVLAAGNQLALDLDGDRLINYSVSEKTLSDMAGVANAGSIIADGGRVYLTAVAARNVAGGVVNNGGLIQARGTVEKDGAIYLTGEGGDVTAGGTLDVSGSDGGSVVIRSDATTLVSGNVNAAGASGGGGTVEVLGQQVGLTGQAVVDASGQTGGGNVLLGGDFHGADPLVQNASQTYVGPDTVITADAVASGNGGKVAIWSDNATQFYGSVSARGGAQGGDGGYVEVSGERYLDYQGRVDLTAPTGSMGTLLLDPTEITITHASPPDTGITVTGTGPFLDTATAPVTGGILTDGTINTQLNTANVTVQTSLGDIAVNTGVAIAPSGGSNTSTLTLDSAANIAWNGNWSYNNNGQLTQIAGNNISGTGVLTVSGTSPVSLQASSGIGSSGTPLAISGNDTLTLTAGAGGAYISNTGNVDVNGTSSGAFDITGSGTLTNASGAISGATVALISTGDMTVANGVTATGGGQVMLTTNAGSITESGAGLVNTTGTLTTSSVTGQTLGGANTIAGFNATNSTNGGVTLTNTGTLGVTVSDTAGGVTIDNTGNVTIASISEGSGDIGVSASGTLTADGTVSTTTSGNVSLQSVNTLTANGTVQAAGSGSVSLQTTGGTTQNIALGSGSHIGATGNSVALSSTGQLVDNGTTLAGDKLALKVGVGAIGSSGSPLNVTVSSVAAQAPDGVYLDKASGDLTVGGVGLLGITGVSATGSDAPVQIATAGVLTTLENITTSGGDILLTGDDFAIGSSIAAGTGSVTFEVANASTDVNLGGGASGAGTAGLSEAELQQVSARILEIDARNGNINFDGSVAFGAAQGDISLKTTGTVTQNAGTALVFPQGFVAQAGAGGVTLNQLGNNFNIVAIDTTGNVTLRDIDSLIVGSIKDVAGTAVHGIAGNNVTVTTGYTTTGDVTAGSATVSVPAAQNFAVGDRILIRGAGTVDAAGTAGVDLYTTVTAVNTGGGTITVADTAGVSGTAKQIVRLPATGTMASGASTVTVGSVSGLNVGDKIVVAGAGPNNGDLTAVIQNITGSPGAYTLQLNATASAAVSGVAVSKPTFIGNATTGTSAGGNTITLGSVSGLSNGDPLIITGADTGGADLVAHVSSIAGNVVTLDTSISTAVTGATVYVTNQSIDASGVVTLNSGADGMTEAGGSIFGSSLLLTGDGSFNLSGPGSANDVATLAADVGGSISYSDVNALTVGTIGSTSGITTRSHITSAATATVGAKYSTANIILNVNTGGGVAGGAVALQINQPIVAGVKDAVTVLQDPADPDGATLAGQVLIFLTGDTNAVTSGSGLIDASLLNLSSDEAKGTYDLTTDVASLSALGGKSTTIDNSAYTGNLTILTLGQFDQKITGTVSSAGNTPGT
ncbi:MAG TPA: filamentous hemagglutinin N-terminal domain-containing protein, partial [Stellaceae bacterium]|nr:filamentous hemagglutinin N-terminal domain-containing protein [Stellaceae bacterium]